MRRRRGRAGPRRLCFLSLVRREWHSDEPSCGAESCVVMYHQPGVGGAYLYQWNDDRCSMKHNFICKYQAGRSISFSSPHPLPYGGGRFHDSFVSSRWQSAARRRNAGPRLPTGARVSEKKEQTRLVSQGTTQHTVCVCRDHTGWESRDLDGNFRYTRARNSLMPIPVIGRTQIWGWWQG